MTRNQERLINRVSQLSSSLADLREENIRDFGELLPHLFFGDLARHAVDLYLATRFDGDKDVTRELHDLLRVLEDSFSAGPDDVQELISVSFLEHLPRPGEEDGWEIRSLIGPEMSKQLEVIG